MICRQLTVSDAAALTALLVMEPLVAGYAEHAADALQDDRYEIWGCYNGDVLMGAIILSLGPFDAEIDSVAVAARHRRTGVGQHLMTHALDRARALGKERMLLEVRESNAPAIALYQRLGFNTDGRRAGYYPPLEGQDTHEAGYLMSYALVG